MPLVIPAALILAVVPEFFWAPILLWLDFDRGRGRDVFKSAALPEAFALMVRDDLSASSGTSLGDVIDMEDYWRH